jgi:hypothetical protein
MNFCYDGDMEETTMKNVALHLSLTLALLGGLAAPVLADEENLSDPPAPPAVSPINDQGTDESSPTDPNMPTDETRENAFTTLVPSIAPSPELKRVVAMAYLDGTLKLIDMARTHLQAAARNPELARLGHAELLAASGKATVASLELFHDRPAARRLRNLALQLGRAESMAYTDAAAALAVIEAERPQLADVFQSELATMGGGAGGVPPSERPSKKN